MNVLVLIGSLRPDSINRRLAHAAVEHLPADADVRIFERLAELPHYDEGLEAVGEAALLPEVVVELRAALAQADALLVVTPEYNGAPSGAIKDAIDWGSRPRGASGLAGLPTAVLAASPSPRGGQWAREGAVRSLTVAGAAVIERTAGVGAAHAALDGTSLVDDVAREAVAAVIDDLVAATRAAAVETPAA